MMTSLVIASLLVTQEGESVVTLSVGQSRTISKYVYGANFPDWDAMQTPFTMARQGGNRMTAYNWETNASNAGSDYRHQNDGYMGNSNVPAWAVTNFAYPALERGAVALVTVPTAGYVSADKGPDNDVNRTPNYLEKRFNKSYASKPGGKFDEQPNLTDKAVYQDEFVWWFEKHRPKKAAAWYSLDNEPDLWHFTHARIVTKQPGYADIIGNNVEFATAIKKVAPKSLVFGPASYGWGGYRTFQGAKDAAGRDFLDVYLQSMASADKKAGRRLLDVLDLHWYPEARGGGERICETKKDSDPAVRLARVQASRSLWDPSYVETSWIADSIGKKPIQLLPRTFGQINKNYPGTKLAFTEYNYGGENDPSGLVAQADVLGLFGRYGVFAASHWGINKNSKALLAAFRAFLNYDGKGSAFGDLIVDSKGENAAKNAIFASLDSKVKGKLTIVAINKETTAQRFKVKLPSSSAKGVNGYLANSKSPTQPSRLATKLENGTVSFVLEPYGVATIEVR